MADGTKPIDYAAVEKYVANADLIALVVENYVIWNFNHQVLLRSLLLTRF